MDGSCGRLRKSLPESADGGAGGDLTFAGALDGLLRPVADAASDLLRHVVGCQTVSSLPRFGVASLPLGSPVELEVIFEVKP
jgi:hypothetical protein